MSESVWAMAPERAAVLPVEKEQGWGKKQKDHSPPNPPSPSLCPITLPGRRTNVLPLFLGGILVCALEWYMHFIECVNIDTILFYLNMYIYIYHSSFFSFPFNIYVAWNQTMLNMLVRCNTASSRQGIQWVEHVRHASPSLKNTQMECNFSFGPVQNSHRLNVSYR